MSAAEQLTEVIDAKFRAPVRWLIALIVCVAIGTAAVVTMAYDVRQIAKAGELAGVLWELSDPQPTRGRMLVVYEAFPKLFRLKDKTNPTGLGRAKEQMIKEGRLPEPTQP